MACSLQAKGVEQGYFVSMTDFDAFALTGQDIDSIGPLLTLVLKTSIMRSESGMIWIFWVFGYSVFHSSNPIPDKIPRRMPL
jgi:hypothetical protein